MLHIFSVTVNHIFYNLSFQQFPIPCFLKITLFDITPILLAFCISLHLAHFLEVLSTKGDETMSNHGHTQLLQLLVVYWESFSLQFLFLIICEIF